MTQSMPQRNVQDGQQKENVIRIQFGWVFIVRRVVTSAHQVSVLACYFFVFAVAQRNVHGV